MGKKRFFKVQEEDRGEINGTVDNLLDNQSELKSSADRLMIISPEERRKILTNSHWSTRGRLVEQMVENAMLSGFYDIDSIFDWLGGSKGVRRDSVEVAYKKVIDKWLEESKQPDSMTNVERTRLVKTAWKLVRECQSKANEAKELKDWVAVKRLELDTQARIAKLTFVEKMIDQGNAPLSINLFGSNTPDNVEPITFEAEITKQ